MTEKDLDALRPNELVMESSLADFEKRLDDLFAERGKTDGDLARIKDSKELLTEQNLRLWEACKVQSDDVDELIAKGPDNPGLEEDVRILDEDLDKLMREAQLIARGGARGQASYHFMGFLVNVLTPWKFTTGEYLQGSIGENELIDALKEFRGI